MWPRGPCFDGERPAERHHVQPTDSPVRRNLCRQTRTRARPGPSRHVPEMLGMCRLRRRSRSSAVRADAVRSVMSPEPVPETVAGPVLDTDPAFALHRGGKIETGITVPLRDSGDLSLAYTPGVARVCTAIAAQPGLADDYTWRGNSVAVVTDGTAGLGVGNIGPAAAMPVMEGKALLFKHFAGVDAMPICLDCTEVDELVETVIRLAPSFGGINLEDISAPRCFEIERRLQEALDIPVFHDDQHGTAVVTLAALRNAAKLTDRSLGQLRAVISGAGAAGVAIAKILIEAGIGDVAVCHRKGVVSSDRGDLTDVKREVAGFTNKAKLTGSLEQALDGADVFIGVSGGTVPEAAVAKMAKD